VVLWAVSDANRLDAAVQALIVARENELIVSVVSLWEIIVKVRIGKLRADLGEIERFLDEERVTRLSISSGHLRALKELPTYHRDPFDHLLIAQAIAEDAVFLTGDRQLGLYPAKIRQVG
jgi:PIN domain nuclease of toxin-antitoxin system